MSETAKFTEDILLAAKNKAQTIISQAEAETQRALEEARADMSRQADDIIRSARAEAEGVKRRQISEVRHRIKLQEQQEKSKILSDVLERTKKQVVDITGDENEYISYLATWIESGIRELGIENVVVHLNANDLKRIDRGKLEREVTKKVDKIVKIDWAKDPVDAMGGAMVSSRDGKTRIANTLDERFEALESKLLIEAGKVLFGN